MFVKRSIRLKDSFQSENHLIYVKKESSVFEHWSCVYIYKEILIFCVIFGNLICIFVLVGVWCCDFLRRDFEWTVFRGF